MGWITNALKTVQGLVAHMVKTDISQLDTYKVDDRGRICIGAEYSHEYVQAAVIGVVNDEGEVVNLPPSR